MKFGVREICDVTFKTTAPGQKVGNTEFPNAGMPAFFIDTATTSSLEQATTTVYANGGRGNSRLLAWEGEKTMTFTVEDALISPMGLSVLSGAGLIDAATNNERHVHITLDKTADKDGVITISHAELLNELGLSTTEAPKIPVCTDIPAYATVIDGSGAGIGIVTNTIVIAGGDTASLYDGAVEVTAAKNATFTLGDATKNEVPKNYANKTVKLDFYVLLSSSVTEVTIAPEDFGGYFYVEAQTLFRREDSGKDMAAEIIIPKAKVQSGFTFSMAATGDPSKFSFTMDAFPGYTMFDKTKKVMCVMQIIGSDASTRTVETSHDHTALG